MTKKILIKNHTINFQNEKILYYKPMDSTAQNDPNKEEISKPGENHKYNDGSDTTVSHDIDKQDNDSSSHSNGDNRGRGRGRGGFRGNRGRGRNFNDNNERKNSSEKNGDDLFVRGIDFNATEDDLREAFSKYGEVTSCKILKDKETNKSKGIGFVNFADKKSAICALDDADNLTCKGRNLQVRFANDKEGEFKGKKGSFNHGDDNGNSRGRGRGGFRGNDRGRGSDRGRGGFRGGERGRGRGGDRGRGRGGDRGRGRGRGNDRGRGGFRGGNMNNDRGNWNDNKEDNNDNGWGSYNNNQRSRSKERNDNAW